MRKFFKQVKIVAALLKAVAKGNVYFAVTSRRKGINDDGLMQYLFATKREAKDYCDWLKYSNKTFEPLDEMLEAKRVISNISNNFVNENLRVYNSFDSLSEGVCKAIADAVTAQAEELINS